MSGDTNRNSQPPSGNGSGSAQNQTQPSRNSSKVRDFLYLDEPKILSYLSQLDGGLKLLVDQVQRHFNLTDKSDPELIERIVATLAGEIDGKAIIVNGQVSGEYQSEREKKTGGDRTVAAREGMSVTRKTLHHEAFDVVVEKMGSKLVTVQGKMSLLPLKVLIDLIKEVNSGDSAENLIRSLSAFDALGITNICYIENRNENVHAFLNAKNFLVEPADIFAAYGSPTEVEFTIVGLHAQMPGRAEEERPLHK